MIPQGVDQGVMGGGSTVSEVCSVAAVIQCRCVGRHRQAAAPASS